LLGRPPCYLTLVWGFCVCVCVQLASAYGKLGNIDANTGDAQTGWDTDQFLTDPKEATLVGAVILKQGGLAPGQPPKQAHHALKKYYPVPCPSL
jgi:xylose isomerase